MNSSEKHFINRYIRVVGVVSYVRDKSEHRPLSWFWVLLFIFM